MADTRGIRAGRAFIELGVSDKLSAGLKAAQKKLEAFGEGLRSIGTKMAGIGVAAITALLGTAKVFSDSGDALDKMSARTGVSVEALSELGYAADLSGTDMESLENGLRVMQKTLTEASQGSKGANEALGRLGLTVQDLAKLSPDEQFKLLADRISRIQDPAARAAMAMELFGKAGTKLLPLMADGAAGINEMQEQARKLGLTVSTETARDAAELNDALGTLWKVLKQGVFTIGGALAPTIKDLTEWITRIVVSATAWVKANKETVVWALKVAAAVAVAGIAIVGLGYIISGIGAALGIVAAVIGGIGTAFSLIGAAIGAVLTPVGLTIAAIVALGGTLLVVTGAGGEALSWLAEKFTELRDWVGKVVGGISDALAAGDIALAAEILWLSLKVIWQQGVAALNKAWLGAKEFFVSTAYSMWYGALAAAEIVFHALEVAWIETTAFLSKTWTNFATGFQMIWEEASSWVAKRMLEIQGLFDDGLDVEAAKKAVDQQLESRLVELQNAAQQSVATGDDIALMLHGLKEAYGYKAYDEERVAPPEVDDLANRLKNYRDLEQFLGYQSELRAAVAYCAHSLPDIPELKAARAAQQAVAAKLKDVRQWIDSPVRLKTELIGHTPASAGEMGTLGRLITEYSTAYTVLHDQTCQHVLLPKLVHDLAEIVGDEDHHVKICGDCLFEARVDVFGLPCIVIVEDGDEPKVRLPHDQPIAMQLVDAGVPRAGRSLLCAPIPQHRHRKTAATIGLERVRNRLERGIRKLLFRLIHNDHEPIGQP